MEWEVSYNRYRQRDSFRNNELYNEDDNNVIYTSYELDIIDIFEGEN